MIEVTYEMVDAAAQAFTTKPTEATYVVARRMIEAALKVHEANKPKPEPVAYTSRGELEDLFYQAEMKAFSDKSDINDMPLYTAPPTREPLSEHEVNNIVFNLSKGSTLFDFARLVEQAHGIGVINENR